MATENTQDRMDGNLKKIADFIKGIDFAMLTTIDANGNLQSRPMATQEIDANGDIYFFTYDNSKKAQQVAGDQRVNLAYAAPSKQDYISICGTAAIVHDEAKMKELWKPQLKAWFPQELETPDIALLKVSVESAELWDAPSSPVSHLIGLVKSTLTGKPPAVGDNETLQVSK